jgi:hypothetical protein
MIIDTDTNCKSKTDFMVKRGIEVVCRYYSSGSSSKNVTKEEAQALSRVESGCGAVVLGRPCRLPPLSSGGALVGRP